MCLRLLQAAAARPVLLVPLLRGLRARVAVLATVMALLGLARGSSLIVEVMFVEAVMMEVLVLARVRMRR